MADSTESEIKDDLGLENMAETVHENLMVVAECIQQGFVDDANEAFIAAQSQMEAIRQYLADKVTVKKE